MCLNIELSHEEAERLLYTIPDIFVGWKIGRYYPKKLELISLIQWYYWNEGVNKETDHPLSSFRRNYPEFGIYAFAKKTPAELFLYTPDSVIFPVIIKKENIKKIGYEELDRVKYLTFICSEVEFSYSFLRDYGLAKKAVEAQLSRTVSGSIKDQLELCEMKGK